MHPRPFSIRKKSEIVAWNEPVAFHHGKNEDKISEKNHNWPRKEKKKEWVSLPTFTPRKPPRPHELREYAVFTNLTNPNLRDLSNFRDFGEKRRSKFGFYFFTYARCRRRLPLIKMINEQEEVFALLLTAFGYEYLFWKYRLTRFWNEVSVSFPKREGRNKPNGATKKIWRFFARWKIIHRAANPLTVLKTPKVRPFLFCTRTTYNVNRSSGCSLIARGYTLSTQKTAEDMSSGRKTILWTHRVENTLKLFDT